MRVSLLEENQKETRTRLDTILSANLPEIDHKIVSQNDRIKIIENSVAHIGVDSGKEKEVVKGQFTQIGSKLQEIGSNISIVTTNAAKLQQSCTEKNEKIEKLEKEIDKSNELIKDLKKTLTNLSEKQAEKDTKSSNELTSLRSQISEMLASMSAANAKAALFEKEVTNWKLEKEREWKDQKKVLEEKVDKLEKTLNTQIVTISVTKSQLETQDVEMRTLRAWREKEKDRELEREKEKVREKEREKSKTVEYATKESVEKLRALVWDLQSGLVAQSSKAMDILLKGWKRE